MVGGAVPSTAHELVAKMLTENHALLKQLLREGCGLELQTLAPLSGSEQVRNLQHPEYRSDGVLFEVDGDDVMSVSVLEPQFRKHPDKRFAWPLYMAGYRAQYRVPVRIIVVTPSRAVARWAAEPIVLDDGSSVIVPIVIGPAEIPTIHEPGANPSPELAVLSTMAHGRGRHGMATGRTAFTALDAVDQEMRPVYADVIFRYLGKRVRETLEAEMRIEGYEYKTKILKDAFTEGKAEGKAEGEARGLALALLKVLQRRNIEVDEPLRQEVLACRDEARLDAWLDKAVTAKSLTDVFE
jgi:hypothetical protein